MKYLDKERFIKTRSSFILSLFDVVDLHELRIVHLLTEAYNEGYKQSLRGLKCQRPPLDGSDYDELIAEIDEIDKKDESRTWSGSLG
jgi:hypothetical protein